MNRFAVVGVMDHLTVFKDMLAEVFGLEANQDFQNWDTIMLINDNKTPDKFDVATLDESTQVKLKQFLKYDIELYEFATEFALQQYDEITSMDGNRRKLEVQQYDDITSMEGDGKKLEVQVSD
eukprot:gene32438-18271_t